MMRFTATRSTAFCAPGARSGGLGSLRVEAIGFRQREQTGAEVLTSLPQAGQEIDAIPAQSLSRQFPLLASVNARQNESGAALRVGRRRNCGGVNHCIAARQVTDKADKWMSEGWVDEAAPRLPRARVTHVCKRVGSFCALSARHFDDGGEPSRS
jgi:hypothetical protein